MICPICKKLAQSAYRPFCSRHCSDVDLAHWLRGDYVTSRPLAEDDLTDDDHGLNDPDDVAQKH